MCVCELCLHLDSLLLAELRQRLLDPERGEPGSTVGVPTLPHNLSHDPQSLHTRRDTHQQLVPLLTHTGPARVAPRDQREDKGAATP